MKIHLRILLVALTLLCTLVTGCSTTNDPAEAYKGETADQIFNRGEEALRDKNYQEAVKRFEALDVQYPYSRHTEIAELHMIYAYYMTSDYASTESAAERFIHAHPMSPHNDYAYYLSGLSNYYQNMGVFERLFAVDFATRDLSQIKKSYANFAEIVRAYPTSHYAPAARQYMVYLRNVLADHELEVAEYYYDRRAYVAAANRANIVVRHYEESPAVPKALVLMVKSYRKLHLVENEKETLDVLEYNYPKSDYVHDAKED